ncbi:Non-structural maintenance of chromosome element 4 [Porphyridium purpureum]|uniref:Non-structural maintenance of chromosomes element 4 n=1 Tax=Porphyridium purpureum TaxID=35688 RepID=A0A5J4Z930_PORPP|nr:Non-structural maintenance of chromosome element 4 [Porphyridium purpureum]|eukprot:POR3334..scf295_1
MRSGQEDGEDAAAQRQKERALYASLRHHAESVRAREVDAHEQSVVATQDPTEATAEWMERMKENEELHSKSQTAAQHVIVTTAFVSLSGRATAQAKHVSTSVEAVELPMIVEKACDAFRLEHGGNRDSSQSQSGVRGFQFDLIAHGIQTARFAMMAPSTDFFVRAEPIRSKTPKKRVRTAQTGELSSRVAHTAQLVSAAHATHTETDRRIKALDQNLRKKGRTSLYTTILDPDSISHTIENLFHASFLVKDGRARVERDANGTVLIEAKEKAIAADTDVAAPTRDLNAIPERREQIIFRLDKAVFQNLKSKCNEFGG